MSQRKLLLADDSITIQKVVNLTFADEGIDVITAGDGDSAMEKITEIKPDLVLADVNMPGLDGYQICEIIKQNEELKKTPVILLVGSFEPFDEEEARRVGADDFLTKPFQSIRQLVGKVTELLNSAEGNDDDRMATAAESSMNFADTQEINLSDLASTENQNQTDDTEIKAKISNEMIQTNQTNSFALDELQKFETSQANEAAEDSAKTRPLSDEELRQFSFNGSETDLEFSEEDILELPSAEDNREAEEETLAQTPTETGQTADIGNLSEAGEETPTKLKEIQSPTMLNFSAQLPPEIIEAIAQRVVEKLSDEVVKDVAHGLIPQMADLIIKKMAEEKEKQ